VDGATSGKYHPANTNFSLCRGERCFYIKQLVQAAHPYIPKAAARTLCRLLIQDNILPNHLSAGREEAVNIGKEQKK
jgi:hypothetical protein